MMNKREFFISVFCFLMVLCSALFAETFYVNGTCGDDSWTGASPDCNELTMTGPKATIEAAILNSPPGSTIIVADGIYGGWLYELESRTLKSANGPGGCIINLSGLEAPLILRDLAELEGFTLTNGWGVRCQNVPQNTITIRNCVFSNMENASYGNGAVLCASNSSVQMIQCSFINNKALNSGGAVYAEGQSTIILDFCSFEGNTAGTSGGAVALMNCFATLLDCTFDLNRVEDTTLNPAGRGGAVYCEGTSPLISYCTFTNNSCLEGGGAITFMNQTSPILQHCTFTANQSFGLDTIYHSGGAIACRGYSSATLQDCNFSGNMTYTNGGALSVFGYSTAMLDDCSLSDNTAGIEGGGVFCGILSSINLDQCQVLFNRANEGAGIYIVDGNGQFSGCDISGNISGAEGGGLYSWRSSVALDKCLLTGNGSITPGSAMTAYDGISLSCSNVTIADNYTYDDSAPVALFTMTTPAVIRNSILWNDATVQIVGYDGISPVISYSDFRNETPPGTGNMSQTPEFASAGVYNDGGTPADTTDDTWLPGDYHVKSRAGRWDPLGHMWVYDAVSSPCIDTGDPLQGVNDEPFPHGDRRNMGAYGGTEQASKSPWCTGPLPGDTNNDCRVDMADFANVAANWMGCNMLPESLCWE